MTIGQQHPTLNLKLIYGYLVIQKRIRTRSTDVYLRTVMPKYAVISVGKDNAYGHPAEETLGRLRDVGAEILRTDELGSIECTSDGTTITFNSTPW